MKTAPGTWPCDHSSASRTSRRTAPAPERARASVVETSRISPLTFRISSLNVVTCLLLRDPEEARRAEAELRRAVPCGGGDQDSTKPACYNPGLAVYGESPRGQPRRLPGARPPGVPGSGRTHGCPRPRAPGHGDEALFPRGPARLRLVHPRDAPVRGDARPPREGGGARPRPRAPEVPRGAHRPGAPLREARQRGRARGLPEGPRVRGHLPHLPVGRRPLRLLRPRLPARHRGHARDGPREPRPRGRAPAGSGGGRERPPRRPRARGGGARQPRAGEAVGGAHPRGVARLLPRGRA